MKTKICMLLIVLSLLLSACNPAEAVQTARSILDYGTFYKSPHGPEFIGLVYFADYVFTGTARVSAGMVRITMQRDTLGDAEQLINAARRMGWTMTSFRGLPPEYQIAIKAAVADKVAAYFTSRVNINGPFLAIPYIILTMPVPGFEKVPA